MFLEKMATIKREEVSRKKTRSRMEELEGGKNLGPPRDFAGGILGSASLALIAEIKRASPSAGVIQERADIREMAREYEKAGASAVSVLTEDHFFRGDLNDLVMVKENVGLPVLQKDFIIDAFQVYEGKAAGADAVLLIAAILRREELEELVEVTRRLGLFPLVEIHEEEELEKISGLNLPLLGINNRNLKTLAVSLETTERLIPKVPPGIEIISESGIRNRKDVARLEGAGVKGILVGEALMRAAEPASKIRELVGRE